MRERGQSRVSNAIADPRGVEIIRPWLRGKDIRAWKTERSGLHIIFTHRGVDIDRYPAVRRYLENFRSKLEKRATAHLHPWYELQQPQEGIYSDFERPKVVWPDIAREIRFAWDESGAYLDMTGFMSAVLPKYCVALLNSPPAQFQIHMLTSTVRGGFVRLKTSYISPLSIPHVTEEQKRRLEALIDRLVEGESPEAVSEVMALASSVYGLNPMETAMLDAWFERRSLEPEGDEPEGETDADE